MTYYHKMGAIPHKRHTQFRQPNGSLYHEELMGTRGFSGIQSLLYHLHPPTQIQKIVMQKMVDIAYADTDSLHHRHLLTATVAAGGEGAGARVPLMANAGVFICFPPPPDDMP